jgi:hypothetical protein
MRNVLRSIKGLLLRWWQLPDNVAMMRRAHGMAISELEARLVRVEKTLNLPTDSVTLDDLEA